MGPEFEVGAALATTLALASGEGATEGAADATALGADDALGAGCGAVVGSFALGALAATAGADVGSGCFPQPSSAAAATSACARDIRIVAFAAGAGATNGEAPQKGQLCPSRT